MGMSGPGLQKGTGPGNLFPRRRLLKGPAVDQKMRTILPTPSVHYIPGVWADADYGEEGHNAGKDGRYAPDLETAMERLATVQIPPTTVVHSGHGLQAFWLFDRLLDVSMDREAAARGQAGWINLLRELFHPFALDSVTDLSRVMRLPGFINNKVSSRPVLVEVISDDGPRTTPAAIEELIASKRHSRRGRKDHKPKPAVPRSPARSTLTLRHIGTSSRRPTTTMFGLRGRGMASDPTWQISRLPAMTWRWRTKPRIWNGLRKTPSSSWSLGARRPKRSQNLPPTTKGQFRRPSPTNNGAETVRGPRSAGEKGQKVAVLHPYKKPMTLPQSRGTSRVLFSKKRRSTG